jgi:AcrR family transcriptional regulator
LTREERREQILDAATVVFEGRDPAVVTFEEIADAAGVSRALVYNYFGDRNGLVEAIYHRSVRTLIDRVTEALATTRGRANALRALVRVHLEFAKDNPSGYRYAANPPVFGRLAELEGRRIDQVAQNLGGGPDACIIASGYLAALETMVLYWLDQPGDADLDRAVDLITAFVGGALAQVDAVGVHLTPRWPKPA